MKGRKSVHKLIQIALGKEDVYKDVIDAVEGTPGLSIKEANEAVRKLTKVIVTEVSLRKFFRDICKPVRVNGKFVKSPVSKDSKVFQLTQLTRGRRPGYSPKAHTNA